PASAAAERGAFQLGLNQYRLGKPAQALETWQAQARQSTPNGGDRAKTLLWLGKAQQALGRAGEAAVAWDAGAAADPAGYYRLRAAALRPGASGISHQTSAG